MSWGIPTVQHKDDYSIKSRLQIINKHCDLKKKNILDIGCGNGFYTLEFARIADFVTGIDINNKSIEQAISLSKEENIFNVVFKCSDIDKLNFNNKFDIITLVEVLEHLPDMQSVLTKTNAWLKDDGILILFVPNKLFPFETHGLNISGRSISSSIGFPFLSWAPEWMRKRVVGEKIFTVTSLKKTLSRSQFNIKTVDFFFPPLDLINIRLARIGRSVFNLLDKTPLRIFALSIFCVAKKYESN
jgi:2-polyprenyl-3-methyl-5-hydroxy-6-metoxy-1,4-benzoquinol methylase